MSHYGGNKRPKNLESIVGPLQDSDVFLVQRDNVIMEKTTFEEVRQSIALKATAGQVVSAHKALVLLNGALFYADPTDPTHIGNFVGISTTSGNTGEEISYIQSGELRGGSFIEGARYYLGLDGALSTSPVAPGASWKKSIGVAKSNSILVLNFGLSVKIGA